MSRVPKLAIAAAVFIPVAATTIGCWAAGSREAPSTSSLADPGPIWAGITDTTSFSARMERHLAAAGEALDALRAADGARTVENTIVPFRMARSQLRNAGRLADVALNAHPDTGFRAHARAWSVRIAERKAALGSDSTICAALAAVDLTQVEPDIRYMTERDRAGYRLNGIDRSPEIRERAAALQAQITALGHRFGNNIFSDRETLRLHADSFAGMPDDWLAAHPPDADGIVTVEVTAASAIPLMTFAERASTREAAFRAQFMAGYPANIPLVDSIRSLRHELATLLGYPSWAAYAAAPMMAESPERIREFLAEADEASAEATRREIAELIARRRIEEPAGEAMDFPSYLYWQNHVLRENYDFDEQIMRQYLPYSRVRDGVLAVFAQMFELDFRPAPGTPVWSPDVEAWEVWENGALIGRFYLDMHPREGKFGHFAEFDLRLGGGTIPEMTLLCNFPGGDEGDPGLLQPDAMITCFHEFGHLVHSLLNGQSAVVGDIEGDFIEAPSQLLEEWAQNPAVLRSYARHYETDEPIPEDLIAAFRRASTFGRATFARASGLWPAVLLLELHAAPPAQDPTTAIETRVTDAYLPFDMPDDFRMSTSLPHLDPYSSNYYTYLWSAVIARDLLTGFDRDDLLDPDTGRRYRDMVLAPTGTAPAALLIERFLGRPFNADAWRAWLEGGDDGRPLAEAGSR